MRSGVWCGQRTPQFVGFLYAFYSQTFPFSSEDGRRPMYLWGMPIMCMGSFGVAASTSLRWLLFWRFVQAFGCAGGVSVGAATIGDIYRIEQRGTAMGIFFGVCMDFHTIGFRQLINSCQGLSSWRRIGTYYGRHCSTLLVVAQPAVVAWTMGFY
jgi:MFS family permease